MCIYIFSRRFYPKRLTIAFRLYIFNQYVCSLENEPTTFCAADAMLYHWSTQEHWWKHIWDTLNASYQISLSNTKLVANLFQKGNYFIPQNAISNNSGIGKWWCHSFNFEVYMFYWFWHFFSLLQFHLYSCWMWFFLFQSARKIFIICYFHSSSNVRFQSLAACFNQTQMSGSLFLLQPVPLEANNWLWINPNPPIHSFTHMTHTFFMWGETSLKVSRLGSMGVVCISVFFLLFHLPF